MIEIANKLYDLRFNTAKVTFKDGSVMICTPLQGIFDDDENGEYMVMYYNVIDNATGKNTEIDLVDIAEIEAAEYVPDDK